ncbi:hypothetical protein F5141DRAFT_1217723 [Pisolithus sp. B1]|nr:hypothetical protein F5141DRAFT_1217723 [Pisolithus sp. B1]
MPPQKLPADPLSKVGPPTGVRKSKRIKAVTAKVQPGRDTHSQSGGGDSSAVTAPPKTRPLLQCSSQSKFITLKNGKWMNQPMVLQQLHASVITMEDIVDEDSIPLNMALGLCGKDTCQTDSKHDERAVEDAVQDTSKANAPSHDTSDPPCATTYPSHEKIGVNGQGSTDWSGTEEDDSDDGPGKQGDIDHRTKDSDSDWSAGDRCHCKLEQCGEEILAGNYNLNNHPPTPSHHSSSTSSESDEGSHTMKVHRQMRGGGVPHFTNDGDHNNEDEGRSAEAHPQGHKPGQLPLEAIQKAQALGACTTQDAQEIADKQCELSQPGICIKLGIQVLIPSSQKALRNNTKTTKHYHTRQTQHYEKHKDKETSHQLWVEICEYWKESVAGAKDMNLKAMVGQVMTCRDAFTQAAQMWCNVEGIHVLGCVIYSSNDEAACQAQGIFAVSQLYEVGIIHGLKNIPWKMLLDLLYVHQYRLLDWPARVPAIGTGFNEQMGDNYLSEVPGDDDENASDDHLVPVPGSSFYLQDWSTEQLEVFRNTDLRMFNIPLVINTYNQPLCLLSDSQAFLKALPLDMDPPSPDDTPLSPSSPLPPSLPLPPSSPPPTCPPSPTRRHVDTQGVSCLLVMHQNTHIQSHRNEGSLSCHSLTLCGLPAHTQPH